MLSDESEQVGAFSWAQRESLRGWLDIELTALARNHYIGAFVYVVVAIVANFTAFALLAYVDWLIYDLFGGAGTPGWIFVASASTLAAAYPLYFWRYHDTEATTQLEYGGDLKISQRGFEASRADPTVGTGDHHDGRLLPFAQGRPAFPARGPALFAKTAIAFDQACEFQSRFRIHRGADGP